MIRWQIPIPHHCIDRKIMANYEFSGTNWEGLWTSWFGLTRQSWQASRTRRAEDIIQMQRELCYQLQCLACARLVCWCAGAAASLTGNHNTLPTRHSSVPEAHQMVTEEKCDSTQQEPALRAVPATVLAELLQRCIDCERAVKSFVQVHLTLLTV